MTTRQSGVDPQEQPGADPQGEAEMIEDLQVSADSMQSVAGGSGDFVITKSTDASSTPLFQK